LLRKSGRGSADRGAGQESNKETGAGSQAGHGDPP
jgi:hypothetical protein